MALTRDRKERRVIHRRPNAVANVTRTLLDVCLVSDGDERLALVVVVEAAVKEVEVTKDGNVFAEKDRLKDNLILNLERRDTEVPRFRFLVPVNAENGEMAARQSTASRHRITSPALVIVDCRKCSQPLLYWYD
jgi:hypothetical protein